MLHPLPTIARHWLAGQGFQIMPTRATKPWPDQPDYWIEIVVTGDQNSPITMAKATSAAAPGKRGRHTDLCGVLIEVKRGATAQELEAAYQHFLAINRAALTSALGVQKYPPEQHPGGRPPTPAVKPKP